jgi:hypothetical protein
MKSWAKKFYYSIAWKKCRETYIISVHGLCEKCSKPGYIVHHKEVLTPKNINNPDVTLNHGKLEYLCLECHNSIHGDTATADGLVFDENGDIVNRRGEV